MISIDFWNTIVDSESRGKIRRKVRIDAVREIAANYDNSITLEEFDKAKRIASDKFHNIWLNQQRTPTSHDLARYVLDYLDISATEKEHEYLATAFEESLWEGPPELSEGVEDIIPQLARQHSLAIISDTMYSPGRILRMYLKEKGLSSYFQSFIFSDETGFSKPDPRAYHQALDATEGTIKQSWHIGDRVDTDITGAKEVGMRTVLFTNFIQYDDGQYDPQPDYVCKNWKEVGNLLC
jgi:putative hydrolase of the HAD superfamily